MEARAACIGITHRYSFLYFPLKAVMQLLIYNYNPLATPVLNYVLSKCLARKISGSWLTLGHLKAINRDDEDGLGSTFLVKTEGHSRVSCAEKTLDDVVSKHTGDL